MIKQINKIEVFHNEDFVGVLQMTPDGKGCALEYAQEWIRNGSWNLAPAYDITYSPSGTNGQHATSLFYNGNPDKALVLKAGIKIRIPKNRCEEIIDTRESVCQSRLPQCKYLE